MKIEEPGVYETIDGDKIEIVDVRGDWAVGWISGRVHKNIAGIWESKSGADVMGRVGKSHVAALYNWTRDIPWDAITPEILTVALDINGNWFGYRSKSKFSFFRGKWESADDHSPVSLDAISMPVAPSPVDSITHRPLIQE